MSLTENNNIILSIDGNIGSGKSTVMQNIRELYTGKKNIIVLPEPIDVWDKIQDEHGTPILKLFYQDSVKHGFAFQIVAMSTRIAALKHAVETNTNSVIITERNLQTDRHVFAQMLHDDGSISAIDFNIYLHMYNIFSGEYPTSKVVYMNASPEVCSGRIMKRNRVGEETIPIEYLTRCGKYHETLVALQHSSPCGKVLTIDSGVDKDVPSNQYFKTISEALTRFIDQDPDQPEFQDDDLADLSDDASIDEFEINLEDDIGDIETLADTRNRCTICQVDLGDQNPRQLCNKTYCGALESSY